MIWFYLLSGLFLGWSLGANDAANVFGTAVGSRMIRFRTAAIVASVFVLIGAVVSGAGATHTLGKLGAVNAMAGSFTVALAAAVTVAWMTKVKLPVSTSQAIVGAIIGWNLFTASPTDLKALTKIVISWIASPILAGIFSAILFLLLRRYMQKSRMHLLELDYLNRLGLMLIGAFGAYSLGANNIANVMGVFVPAQPFKPITLPNGWHFSGTQILFLLGALAISVGIFTYSQKVIRTVGRDLYRLTPAMALVVVLAESLVLFLFSSESVERLLTTLHLPTLPLVPVSSSQAVIGAVLGIALVKGGRGVQYRMLGKIVLGWAATPLAAGLLAFVSLFFVQNVFEAKVSKTEKFLVDRQVLEKVSEMGVNPRKLENLENRIFQNRIRFSDILKKKYGLKEDERQLLMKVALQDSLVVDTLLVFQSDINQSLTRGQREALRKLAGRVYSRRWQLAEDLGAMHPDWDINKNPKAAKILQKKMETLFLLFSISQK